MRDGRPACSFLSITLPVSRNFSYLGEPAEYVPSCIPTILYRSGKIGNLNEPGQRPNHILTGLWIARRAEKEAFIKLVHRQKS